jgi:putative ABC transport system permease protein
VRWIYALRLRLRSVFRRTEVEEELRAEFQYHLDRQIEQNAARGMGPEEARQAALRSLGGLEQRKEECRDRRGVAVFDQLAQDLRYAARTLRAKPAFTLAAVFSLALGIGANTAVFSLVNALLLTKLPVGDPDNLYQLIATHRTYTRNAFSYVNFQKLQANFTDIFDDVAIFNRYDWECQIEEARLPVHGALVSGNFYRFLGVQPAIGRLFETGDDTAAGASVAVLGYGFWQREFSGRADVLGKVIRIEGAPFTIIGVAPSGFGGAEIDYPREVTLPAHARKRYDPRSEILENPGFFAFSALVRLKPGVKMQAAQAILRDLWPRVDEDETMPAADNWRPRLDIAPGGFGVSRVRSEFSQALLVVMVLVALLLLMMCANLAGLLVARAVGRSKEVAVRMAMGAGLGRLIRQSLTEALLLAALGGAASLLLASFFTQGLLLFLPPSDGGFLTFHLDGRMLGFAGAVTLLTALLFGLLPAFQGVRVPLNAAMSEGGRVPGTQRRPRVSRAVIVAQVSVSLALVIASLLNARSLRNLSDTNLGFQPDGLYLLDLNPGRAGIRGENSERLYKNLLDELNRTPWIVSAAQSRITPVSGSQWWDSAGIPGYTPERDEATTVYLNQVTAGYFRTMGTRMLDGREFTAADDATTRRVAVVNESFARHFFPSAGRSRPNPVGRIFSVGPALRSPNDERFAMFRNLEIVGVAADTKYTEPREAQKDLVYLASEQSGGIGVAGTPDGQGGRLGNVGIRLGPGVNPARADAEIRQIVNRFAGGLDVQFRPFNAVFDRSLERDRLVAALSGLFGFLGLALASIGLYGVMAQSVAAQAGEIGIRMALGAHAGQVQGMVLREALALVAAGVCVGLPLSIGFAQFMGGLLYGVRPWDPRVLAGAAGLMAVAGMAAAWLPARRASKIDPMAVLRQG